MKKSISKIELDFLPMKRIKFSLGKQVGSKHPIASNAAQTRLLKEYFKKLLELKRPVRI
jgi:hypothetical protein